MPDLSARYMSLDLRNPVIIASSPLTADIANLRKCEEAGAGAVVLKSIFEEQIESQVDREILQNEEYLSHADAALYFENVSKGYYVNEYLKLLREAKKELSIPVIASINCTNLSTWVSYIKEFENAGADAIELNYYPIASAASVEGRTVDRLALDFASKVKREASRPVSIKIGSRYSSLANMIKGFDVIGIDALVLFNRFYRPDIDIESMTLSQAANPLSSSHEYAESLRWIALMSGEVKCDLCASTGIHDGETMIKMLLAGASACQICTAALKDLSIIRTMCDTLSAWMSRHGFSSISDFRGRLAQENMEETGLWERTQYIKKLSGSN